MAIRSDCDKRQRKEQTEEKRTRRFFLCLCLLVLTPAFFPFFSSSSSSLSFASSGPLFFMSPYHSPFVLITQLSPRLCPNDSQASSYDAVFLPIFALTGPTREETRLSLYLTFVCVSVLTTERTNKGGLFVLLLLPPMFFFELSFCRCPLEEKAQR